MRKFLLLTGLCGICFIADAQVRISLAGGINHSTITPQLVQFPDTTATVTKRTAIHIGLLADVPLIIHPNLYLQTGVSYAARGAKFQQFFDTALHNLYFNAIDLKVNYIDIPFTVLYKMPLSKGKKFFIGAGPQASLFYNGSMTVSSLDKTSDFNEEINKDLAVGKKDGSFKTVHFMANAMAGFEFRKMFVRANYSRSVTDFYQVQNQGYKNISMGATIGFFLGNVVPDPLPVKDRDKDGIPDAQDACPDKAGPPLFNGCPDNDGDGIDDRADDCPDVAGSRNYQGCPVPDRDADGLNDESDNCPDVPGTAKYNGCPVPDTDGDGMNDETDACPQVPGTDNGCPLVVDSAIIEKINFAAQQIQFKTQSAQLTPASLKTLDSLSTLLLQDPELKLTVEGHTSLDGKADFNMRLSQQRADAVKQYLVSKRIDAARITSIGYGSSRLLYTGNDPDEVQKNRRVELKINY